MVELLESPEKLAIALWKELRMNIILVQWDVNVIFHSQWGPKFMKEVPLSLTDYRNSLKNPISLAMNWNFYLEYKLTLWVSGDFLGQMACPSWRSGYLLSKLSPQAANTKMSPLTAAWSSLLLWALIQGKYTLTVNSSVHARAQFFLQVQLLPGPFCLAGYLLKHPMCWLTVLLGASLYASFHEHCQKEIFRLENCGLKSLNLFISVLRGTKS